MTKKLEKLSGKTIEKKIIESTSDAFILNKNYEIIVPSNGKTLIDCRCFEAETIKEFFSHLYQKAESNFSARNVTVDSTVFSYRLSTLLLFLKKAQMGTETDQWAFKRIRQNIYYINGEIKIDALTQRIFDDFRNPMYSKSLISPDVKKVLYKFCQQWHLEKQELLFLIEKSA